MDTLAEEMARLHDDGWTAQITAVAAGLECGRCAAVSDPEDVEVDDVFRFEGDSNPGDEAILFAITPACGHRGTLAASYGPDTPAEVTAVVTRLPLRDR
jgi:hypothetical protein